MGKALMILNEPAYGSERAYNGLRLAGALAKRDGAQVRVFLIGDAVTCAKRGQRVPSGYYSLETMLGTVLQDHGEVGVCGSCLDARGIADADLTQGAPKQHGGTCDLGRRVGRQRQGKGVSGEAGTFGNRQAEGAQA